MQPVNEQRTLTANERRRLAVLALLAFIATGCTSYPRLEPAPGAEQINGERVISRFDGVIVQIDTDAWQEPGEVRRYTTPLQVTVRNESERPVTLRYQDFALVRDDGTVYSALPPFEIEGTIRRREGTVVARPLLNTPRFYHRRFLVSPYYAHIYPSLTRYPGAFYHDPLFHDRYYTIWRDIDLPTEEMLERALPEGIIQPGGEVRGMVYFEPLEDAADKVRFQFDLVDGGDADAFGEVSIPLLVTR